MTMASNSHSYLSINKSELGIFLSVTDNYPNWNSWFVDKNFYKSIKLVWAQTHDPLCIHVIILIRVSTDCHNRGVSRISGVGVHMYKGAGVRFADFISFFLDIPWKWNNLVSLQPNYFIFIGYLKMGAGRGVLANPLWICYCISSSLLKLGDQKF